MDKIKIHIPSVCQNEVKYTFHCLIKKFLGLEIEFLISKNEEFYLIEGKNGKNLKIENRFFNSDNPQLLFLESRIPSKVEESTISFLDVDYQHISLFGKAELQDSGNEYLLKSDLIAASFFMLSRWEEKAHSGKMDHHERFPLESSLAYKNNFYHRPIVNEYLELLKSILNSMGWTEILVRDYKAVISYDIDKVKKWRGFKTLLQSIYLNAKQMNIGRIVSDKLSFFGSVLGMTKDPYFSFDFILDSLKGHKIEAILYFKTGVSNLKYDKNIYKVSHPNIQKVFKKLIKEDVIIGLHPSYYTFKDKSRMKMEMDELKTSLPEYSLERCRQHYLRFSLPETWRIMDSVGFKTDSSMMYAKEPGFRCGICYTFPVFDFERRKRLNLEESPLIFMESRYVGKADQILPMVSKLTETIKKYQGENIVLWHNNNLFYKKHRQVYKQVLDIISPK